MFLRNKDFTAIMVNCNKDKLIQLASRFRAAIMQCDPESLIITLRNFPRGACGDATLLLAKYLEENECGKFEYICGDRENYSHAWLHRDGLIIDITADQFEDHDCPVFVSKDHSWHSQFEIDIRRTADFMQYDEFTVATLSKSYKEILETIKNTQQAARPDKC